MFESFSAAGSFVQMPCGPRKSGMPDSVEIPAPVRTTMRVAPSIQAETSLRVSDGEAGPATLNSVLGLRYATCRHASAAHATIVAPSGSLDHRRPAPNRRGPEPLCADDAAGRDRDPRLRPGRPDPRSGARPGPDASPPRDELSGRRSRSAIR